MFYKVLLSDDLGSINKGVQTVMNALEVKEVQQVQYCDDAYLKIKKAHRDGEAFNLLITDLSFTADHRQQKFLSGEALVKTLRTEFPHLKIIVYSIEDRLQKVRLLMQEYGVHGYVCKGRKGLEELAEAMAQLAQDESYVSPQIRQALDEKNDLDIDNYDIELLTLLAQGFSQEEISISFKNSNRAPSSLSSIEKRLNRLKVNFKAANAIQLIAIAKDLGLI